MAGDDEKVIPTIGGGVSRGELYKGDENLEDFKKKGEKWLGGVYI